MTCVGNKSAYLEVVHDLNAKLQSEDVQFSIVVFDINSLKRINDDYGHEEGDNLLINSAKCFKKVFDSKNVFQIGGDEFIAVMENVTENDMSNLLKQLDKEVDDFNNVLKDSTTILVSFSKGFATYSKSKHHEFREVFKEADENLYIDKENYYKDKPQRRLY